MFANVRIRGQNGEGILILELDLGRDPGELGNQDGLEREEGVLEPLANEDEPPVDERDCRYCMVPEDFEDLISPCGCRGSLRWCHHRCLKRWALMKKHLSCELCGQPHEEAMRVELLDEGVQEKEDELEEPPNQMSEARFNEARRPRSSKDDPEDEPPPRQRRLEDNQVVILTDEEDDTDDGDEEEEEYEEGVYDEDNDVGEEEDPTYSPGRRVAPVWNGEHWELGEL